MHAFYHPILIPSLPNMQPFYTNTSVCLHLYLSTLIYRMVLCKELKSSVFSPLSSSSWTIPQSDSTVLPCLLTFFPHRIYHFSKFSSSKCMDHFISISFVFLSFLPRCNKLFEGSSCSKTSEYQAIGKKKPKFQACVKELSSIACLLAEKEDLAS